ncbi:MAG: TolC family protein [Hydrogenophaga sp.]|uniref:TolC family protein n=1 Tax=Hydrogenophaga sp. TaxID=1904254 RepID=UPI003D9B6166
MTSPRRSLPPVVQRRWRRWCAVTLTASACALGARMAGAQTPSDALAAADPATPAPALASPALLPLAAPVLAATPRDLREALARWRQANQQVAEFPRGHADLLRWEAGQTPPARTAPATPPPVPLGADEAVRLALALHPVLIERPGTSAVERQARQQARLALEHSVRRGWITAVAAHTALRHQAAALESTRIGAELGQRMVAAGNWSQARLLREQLTQARAEAAWLQTQQTAHSATEALARALGLWQADAVLALPQRLPTELPALPPLPANAPTEAQVLASHPALAWQAEQLRRQQVAVPAAQRQAWAHAQAEALAAAPAQPPTLADTRLLKDHALERAVQAEAQLLQAASERRSWAREAWARLQTSHASARHAQDVTLPLLQAAEQETLLRYNGMLQSTWDLLAAARERLQGAQDAAQARRDHWLALADWQALLAGGGYSPAGAGDNTSAASATPDGDH